MRRFVFVFFFVISSLWAVPQSPVVIEGGEEHIKLTPHVSYYLDKDSQLDQHTVRSKDILFKQSSKQRISFGHQYDATLWVTFTLYNSSAKPLEYLLVYDNPLVEDCSLYTETGKLIGSAGILHLKQFRRTLGHSVKLSLPAKTTATYYMKIENHISSMKLELSLWDSGAYIAEKSSHWNVMALFSGAMLILIFYNLMLFVFTGDKSYFYYILVTFAMLIHEVYASAYVLFIPNIPIINSVRGVDLMILVTFVFIPMFARSFLQLQTLMPRIDLYLKYLPIALVFVTLLSVYEVIPTFIHRVFFVVVIMSVIGIAYIALFKGVKQARYYVLGWTVVLVTFISMALSRAGILTFDPEHFHLTTASILFEALVFSIGLAARIRYVKNEKEASDARLILHQKEEKERLEYEVSVRTQELSKALSIKSLLLKEVHHRVKNNMQIIISLLRLQADQFDDKRLQEAMSVSEQRIKSMGSVHEMLYANDDISKINAKEYFSLLAAEARSAYDIGGNVIVTITTNVSLDMERAIYTGLIINELVSNAYKYAFDSKGGEINISLVLDSSEYLLQVQDNGKGGSLIGSSTSLGMLLVKTLVTKQLKGSIVSSTDEGIRHEIRFKEDAS